MRGLVLIAFLLLTVSCLKAQRWINKTREYVLIGMDSTKTMHSMERGVARDSTSYMAFEFSDHTIVCYFNHENICISEKLIKNKSYLIEVIGWLNSNFTKVDDNNWVDKHNKFRFSLVLSEDSTNPYLTLEISEI